MDASIAALSGLSAVHFVNYEFQTDRTKLNSYTATIHLFEFREIQNIEKNQYPRP